MTDGGALLVAKGLEKRYDVPVIEGVDLDLRPGECHALVGENGAGKTTLVKILSGLTPASGGAMTLDGAPYRPTDRTAATAPLIAQYRHLHDWTRRHLWLLHSHGPGRPRSTRP